MYINSRKNLIVKSVWFSLQQSFSKNLQENRCDDATPIQLKTVDHIHDEKVLQQKVFQEIFV